MHRAGPRKGPNNAEGNRLGNYLQEYDLQRAQGERARESNILIVPEDMRDVAGNAK